MGAHKRALTMFLDPHGCQIRFTPRTTHHGKTGVKSFKMKRGLRALEVLPLFSCFTHDYVLLKVVMASGLLQFEYWLLIIA